MAEKVRVFESRFHQQYVGGEGEVVEKPVVGVRSEYKGLSYDTVLSQYRQYVNDPRAELPKEILDQLDLGGKI